MERWVEIHGSWSLFGFERATALHTYFAWALIGVWVFAIFWHLTTGEWRQYLPSSSNSVLAMVKYYTFDIFVGGGHPFHKTRQHKFNPLQRLAYLSLHLFMAPLIWLSGWFYLFYSRWDIYAHTGIPLEWIALAHTAGAFLILTFLIAHLYLALAMGERPLGHLKAMITGREEER
ncbi:cytochrome B [Ectothiorhodospiraceae bacterium BW-2]|nr:cytochrome B [Ectothiorhodospiraceae bacterium BW-2]